MNPPSKKRNFLPVIALVLLAAAAVTGAVVLGLQNRQQQAVAVIQPPPTVAVSRGDVVFSVTAPGLAYDSAPLTVTASVSGSVVQTAVRPGDVVHSGQILLQIGSRSHFEAQVADAQIRVMQAQAVLDGFNDALSLAQAQSDLAAAQAAYREAQYRMNRRDVVRGDRAAIDAAMANLILLQAALKDAEEAYNAISDRPDGDYEKALALSQMSAAQQNIYVAQANLAYLQSPPDVITVADAQAQLDLARAVLDKAQVKYDQLKAGQNPARTLASAQLKSTQAGLQEAQEALAALEVKAPMAGVITSVLVQTGQNVLAGTVLLTLSNPQVLEISATVVEQDFPLVETGQVVQLYFEALPEVNLTGRVARLVPQRSSSTQAIYPVFITLDSIPAHLAPGMTTDASIVIGRRSQALRLPRALVHARSDGTADVQVWSGGQAQARSIQVGLRGDSFIEILSGLAEGELVVAQ